MIITRDYAKRLLTGGRAINENLVAEDRSMGRYYVAIDRVDLQRVDHYLARGSVVDLAKYKI